MRHSAAPNARQTSHVTRHSFILTPYPQPQQPPANVLVMHKHTTTREAKPPETKLSKPKYGSSTRETHTRKAA